MLEVTDVSVRYGQVRAIRSVSLRVEEGEIVALVGANGAGKTTTLRAIAGAVPLDAGEVSMAGRPLSGLSPEEVVRAGVVLAPEGRRIFSRLTVEENLLVGASSRTDRERVRGDLEELLDRFPILRERRRGPGGALSGGEQQQLALARSLIARPRLLLLDEPSLGLAPRLMDEVMELVAELRAEGQTILLVEQNVGQALEIADRGYVLQSGEVVLEGPATQLLESELVEEAYLGEGSW